MHTSYPFNISKSYRPKAKQSIYFQRNPCSSITSVPSSRPTIGFIYPWLPPPCFPLEQPSHFLVAIGYWAKKAHLLQSHHTKELELYLVQPPNFFHLVSCVFFKKHLLNILFQIHLRMHQLATLSMTLKILSLVFLENSLCTL